MTFNEYKNTINMVESCEPCEGWDFDRMITLLQDVVIKLDSIENRVDEAVGKITDKLDD